MIDGAKHETVEPVYNGKIPLNATYLNQMQDNIEDAINLVNADDITFSDGQTFQAKYDSGELKGQKGDKGDKGDTGEQGLSGTNGTNGTDGEDGFSPTVAVKTNTDTEYVLTVTNKTGSFDTPNLKGADGQDGTSGTGEGGTNNYSDLNNKPKINNVELSGNKTLDDLGIASKDSLTTAETNISTLQTNVNTAQENITTIQSSITNINTTLGDISTILDNINGEVVQDVNNEQT